MFGAGALIGSNFTLLPRENTMFKAVIVSLAALLCLTISPAWAKQKPSEAATRDPHVLKLTSDGEVGFLRVAKRIEGQVPRGASVVADIQGLDSFTRAAIIQYIVSSGTAKLVERDVLGTKRVVNPSPSTNAAGAASAPSEPAGAFDLPVENVQVRAPDDAYRWQSPHHLLQMSIFKGPHRPTAALFLAEGSEMPTEPVCVSVRTIDAADGTIAWYGIKCGQSSTSAAIDMATQLIAEAAAGSPSLRSGTRVLQLPVEVITGNNAQRLPTENVLYYSLNNALAQRGCSVQAVPPGATTGGRDGELWSYHPVPFEPVTTTLIEGWIQARYAIKVSARSEDISAGSLLEQLSESMDEQLIDPDLVTAKENSEVQVLVMDVEAVDLNSGRILTSAELSTGRDASRDMLAQVVSSVLFGGAASAWVEVRPIPQTATAKVDRAQVRVVEGMGLVTLRPGKHNAELTLAGGSRPDAQASFETGEYQYGVLALAAPFGSLMVTTTPPGAEILVDSQSWGPSPVERTIGGGDHEVLARVDGCGEKTAHATVLIGDQNSVLIHLDGFVEASVNPAHASIVINGKDVGTGQARAQVPYGANEIAYRNTGYRDHKAGLMVESCETTPSSFSFDGTIVTKSTPDRAEVRIDGEKVGRALNRSIVPIGTHQVSCHWCEYGSGSTQVQVGPGQEVPVDITLDGSGFRFALGPYAGLDMAPNIATSGARLGAMGEAWFTGRWGLQLLGDIGTEGAYQHFAVGPAVRTLFPAPGLALPIALRADMVYQGDAGLTVFPTLALDLRICVGRATSLRIGAAGGVNPGRAGFLGSVDVGLLFRGGSPWKDAEE